MRICSILRRRVDRGRFFVPFGERFCVLASPFKGRWPRFRAAGGVVGVLHVDKPSARRTTPQSASPTAPLKRGAKECVSYVSASSPTSHVQTTQRPRSESAVFLPHEKRASRVERRSDGMTELSRLRGSEGYAVRDDAGVWGAFFWQAQKKASQRCGCDRRMIKTAAVSRPLFGDGDGDDELVVRLLLLERCIDASLLHDVDAAI